MRQTPSWKHQVPEDYQMEKDGVVGNFEEALRFLIESVKKSEGVYSSTLIEYDRLRGNDHFTSTRKQEFGTFKEEK